MRLSELQDNQKVEYKAYRAADDKPSDWQTGYLYLIRRNRTIRQHSAGDILTIAIRDIVCAEYGEQDYFPPSKFEPSGVFLVEDWYLEINGLEGH